MAYGMLLGMAALAKVKNAGFQQHPVLGGMGFVAQFALPLCYRFMHDRTLEYVSKIRVASNAEFPLVFPYQEFLIGRMSGMTCSAFAREDRWMNDRPVELLPFFRMARATEAVLGSYQIERARAVGGLMAIGTELFYHGHVRNFSCERLFGRRMGVMAIGAAIILDRVVGVGFCKFPFGTVMTFLAQLKRPIP
jgi:hypothetical protein